MKRLVLAMMACVMMSGCSAYMAASGEDKKDLDILRPGTDRDRILAEFGMPVSSIDEPIAEDPATAETTVTTSGTSADSAAVATLNPANKLPPRRRRYDIFKFVQGRSTASNAGRAVFYGTAAVLTLGLSEVIATPLEYAVGDQGEIRLRTSYDMDWRLTRSEILDAEEWVPIPEYNNRVRQREQAVNDAAAKQTN